MRSFTLYGKFLLSASKRGPVFRTLFLPSCNPIETVAFYLPLGFQEKNTHIEGVSRDFTSVVNEWHRIVFYPQSNKSQEPVQDCLGFDGVVPRFICTDSDSLFKLSNLHDSEFNEYEAVDPDGRLVVLCKPSSSLNASISGILCWIDRSESFTHTFIRIEQIQSECLASVISVPLRYGSFLWPQFKPIPVISRSQHRLKLDAISELAQLVKSAGADDMDEVDWANNNTFFRFLVASDADSTLEITAPLSQLEKAIKSLSKPLRKILCL